MAAEADDDDDEANGSSTGDLISVGLRPGFEEYDFAIPFILREQVEALEDTHIDPSSLAPFGSFSLQQLKGQIGQGEKFHSEDVQAKTRFGDYRVHGGVMTATGYNDYLARITRRITEAVILFAHSLIHRFTQSLKSTTADSRIHLAAPRAKRLTVYR